MLEAIHVGGLEIILGAGVQAPSLAQYVDCCKVKISQLCNIPGSVRSHFCSWQDVGKEVVVAKHSECQSRVQIIMELVSDCPF